VVLGNQEWLANLDTMNLVYFCEILNLVGMDALYMRFTFSCFITTRDGSGYSAAFGLLHYDTISWLQLCSLAVAEWMRLGTVHFPKRKIIAEQ